MKNLHFLLITYPAQGHINPTLQLAKRLLCGGAAKVTFATTVHGLSKMKILPSHDGLSYASFSDGFDNGTKPSDDQRHILSEFKRMGSQTLHHLIQNLSKEGHPVDFLVYGIILSWAAEVARDMSIPSAFLCTQSASAFAIYRHFFNTHEGIYNNNNNNPPSFVNIPGLLSFAQEDLPSFLLPTSPIALLIPYFREHIQNLEKDPNPCVLLNTFDALEEEAIKNVANNINLISIGPLVPFDNKPAGCDLFEASKQYIEWLNTKPDRSVVYASFGSLAVLQRKQMVEIFHGLVSTGIPFMWVIRSLEDDDEFKAMIISELDGDNNNNNNNNKQGLIVPWCSQVEVLSHQSVGCFVTHCGWNSTLESLVAGVPVVGFPQFSDQLMNAKMVEDLWGTGIRARVNHEEEDGIVKREEIKRCVEIVMGLDGEKGEEIRKNAAKWRGLSLEASSDVNLMAFMEKLGA
ncbi:hypothetical protein Ddye_010697 [Dipteronia dyeriana]|uniref:Glycosyltransferase n=1 Tax=Dipteronia dyeriana TaxID=168575 RepID=A0AAD9XDQ4_9ROSI|nr:hypothetical protein Ddye_010697 [Dipteronia dyeriana]